MSKDPSDYYSKADKTKIREAAFAATFGSWSDKDWEEFQDHYLHYVKKL